MAGRAVFPGVSEKVVLQEPRGLCPAVWGITGLLRTGREPGGGGREALPPVTAEASVPSCLELQAPASQVSRVQRAGRGLGLHSQVSPMIHLPLHVCPWSVGSLESLTGNGSKTPKKEPRRNRGCDVSAPVFGFPGDTLPCSRP